MWNLVYGLLLLSLMETLDELRGSPFSSTTPGHIIPAPEDIEFTILQYNVLRIRPG
jgi:hypothetical protein